MFLLYKKPKYIDGCRGVDSEGVMFWVDVLDYIRLLALGLLLCSTNMVPKHLFLDKIILHSIIWLFTLFHTFYAELSMKKDYDNSEK